MRATFRASLSIALRKRSKPRQVSGRGSSNGRRDRTASEESYVDVQDVLRNVRALELDFVYEDVEGEYEDPWIERIADGFRLETETGSREHGGASSITEGVESAYSKAQGFNEIDVAAFHRLLLGEDRFLLVDVRNRIEYSKGHVSDPRCLNVPFDELERELRDGGVSKDVAIYTLCETGTRSAQAAVRLAKVYGFKNVTNIAGGMRSWREAGFFVREERG